jgi:flagellar biosynthesis protein FlhF
MDRMEEMYRMLVQLRDEATPAPGVPVALRPMYRELCRREFPAAVARQLLTGLPGTRRGRADTARRPDVRAAAGRAFRVQGLGAADGQRRVVALVGPTGVGKTTTIAKLAGQCRQAGGGRVALMSLDTYRIGAMAQMQIYAELLGAPFYVVRDRTELAKALQAEATADLVLVDSMGRSPQHRDGIATLRALLAEIPTPEVHLVVSATTKGSDLEEVMRRFRPLRYQHLLITKLDEARSAGPVLGLALEHDLSVSYLTTGQEVPDDLEPATPDRLSAFLFPGGPVQRTRTMVRA